MVKINDSNIYKPLAQMQVKKSILVTPARTDGANLPGPPPSEMVSMSSYN